MKKIIILAIITLMVVGCGSKTEFKAPLGGTSENISFHTVMIDSCEYVMSVYRLAHKGNCHFCAERRKQELKELIEQLKEK